MDVKREKEMSVNGKKGVKRDVKEREKTAGRKRRDKGKQCKERLGVKRVNCGNVEREKA